MLISVDVGYKQVKAIGEQGKKIIFPSVKAPVTNDPTGGVFKKDTCHRVKIRTFDRTSEDLVGEAALESLAVTSTLSREKSSELHDLFILTAAYLCGASGFTDLAVGLPLAFYRFQRQELQNRLGKIQAHVTVDHGPERYISISRVVVFPQGVGVLFSSNIEPTGLVAVIDIGYYTTDYLLCDSQDGFRPIPELCGSIDSGVHLVNRLMSGAYQNKTGALAPKNLLDYCINQKPIYFNGKILDLNKDFQEACRRVAEQITQEVLAIWSHKGENASKTILAGGGALLLKDYLKFPNHVIPKDPVFANAKGFLSLLQKAGNKTPEHSNVGA